MVYIFIVMSWTEFLEINFRPGPGVLFGLWTNAYKWTIDRHNMCYLTRCLSSQTTYSCG